jgi:tRNA nucleotidyltransferase (CCA-adding enzyme)
MAASSSLAPARLRPSLAARVAVVARLAAERGIAAYLVGGTVRDLLLGRDSPDLDFVVVGDGLELAAAAARELGGRLVRHADFLTADVIDAGGVHLDLATARQESYKAMAALPEVWPAAIEEDLLRRDFTVNAMALPLVAALPPRAPALGGLLDLYGGRRDLEAGALRVLHDRSFLDDPTRVLRGVRFEARLGLRLTPETEALAREAVAAGAFARLTGSRLRHELELLLGAEPWPAVAMAGLERLQELGVLAAVHPRLSFDAAARRRLLEAAAEHAWHRAASSAGPEAHRWLLLLLALADGLSEAERGELAERLLLAGDELRLVSRLGGLEAVLPRLGPGALPHEVDAALEGLGGEELLLLAARSNAIARSWVRRYLTELRPLALGIRGADLLAAGARRGPEIGRALRATRDARLDGEIGADDELDFALALVTAPAGGGAQR